MRRDCENCGKQIELGKDDHLVILRARGGVTLGSEPVYVFCNEECLLMWAQERR